MSANGAAKKAAAVGLVAGLLLVVLRVVRGGEEGDSAIDRVDTGNDRNEEPVDTGLDRVDTAEEATESAEETTEEGTVSVDVEATTDRFDSLDVFDYLAIVGAAYKAAKREYDQRA